MIAYMLQIHDRFDQALRLLQAIHSDDNIYFIVVDSSVEPPEEFRRRIGAFHNAHLLDDLPGTWGGASLLSSTLETIGRALDASVAWRWFINLSGVDVPLKTQPQIFRTLQARREAGERSFIADFGSYEFERCGALDRTVHDVSEQRLRPDLRLRLMGGAQHLFEGDAGPITRPEYRIRVHVDEDISTKTLSIRLLNAVEARSRAAFFARYPYHFGRQWFVLDREACKFAVESSLALSLYDVVKNVMIPDECFFQTLLRAAADEIGGVVFDENFRFYLGEPVFLHDPYLPDLRRSDAFFARKFFPEAEGAEELKSYLASIVGDGDPLAGKVEGAASGD